ncbi:hypothetical protein HS088_TW09G00515 [Tripterygium wilfordii]|uniref:Uncharacterized protein n=1 Tax=Tripterygium wilfordii TaxID=458696 RepID=A0A7J7D8S9_TRIWF|nr:hypothetical protein HS088_TW09G00515 [Tripterygium wilfordii]
MAASFGPPFFFLYGPLGLHRTCVPDSILQLQHCRYVQGSDENVGFATDSYYGLAFLSLWLPLHR